MYKILYIPTGKFLTFNRISEFTSIDIAKSMVRDAMSIINFRLDKHNKVVYAEFEIVEINV